MPMKDLIWVRFVCKWWQEVISDNAFELVKSQRSFPVSGFFFQHKGFYYNNLAIWNHEDSKTRVITYIPVEGGVRGRQLVLSFLPEDVKIMSSANGLVCCSSLFNVRDMSVYVCNPMNKDQVRIEWTDSYFHRAEDSISLAFDPSKDIIANTTSFKLVRLQRFGAARDSSFSFSTYSSHTGTWRSAEECCRCGGTLKETNGTCVGRILHWLKTDWEILSFDTENDKAFLIPIPDLAGSITKACIGESNGKLHCIIIAGSILGLWSLEDNINFEWKLEFSRPVWELGEVDFGLNLFQTLDRSSSQVDLLAYKDGFLLIRVGDKVHLYQVETNIRTEISSIPSMSDSSTERFTVVPYSLSVVPLKLT